MKCKICGNTCEVLKSDKLKAVYYQCSNCEFIFKDAKDYLSATEEKLRYDLHNNQDDSYQNFFKELCEIVNHNHHGGLGLDFGSGPYPMLYKLLSKDYKMNKYDKYYDDNTTYQNFNYDFITMTEVIEHLSEPLAIVEHLQSLLKNKGMLYIMTELSDNKEFVDWWYHRDVTHIAFFATRTFEVISEITNLELVDCNQKNIVVLRKCNDDC